MSKINKHARRNVSKYDPRRVRLWAFGTQPRAAAGTRQVFGDSFVGPGEAFDMAFINSGLVGSPYWEVVYGHVDLVTRWDGYSDVWRTYWNATLTWRKNDK